MKQGIAEDLNSNASSSITDPALSHIGKKRTEPSSS